MVDPARSPSTRLPYQAKSSTVSPPMYYQHHGLNKSYQTCRWRGFIVVTYTVYNSALLMLPCFLTTEREREQRDEWGEGTKLNSKMCQYVTGPRLESEVNSKMTYCAVVYKFIVSTRSPTFTRNQIFQVDRRLGLPIVPRVRGWRVPNFGGDLEKGWRCHKKKSWKKKQKKRSLS